MMPYCKAMRCVCVCDSLPTVPTRSYEKRCAFGTAMSFCTRYVLPRYEVDMGMSVVRLTLDGCIIRRRL